MHGNGPEEEESIAVALTNTMLAKSAFPGLVAGTYSGIEVSKNDQLVSGVD